MTDPNQPGTDGPAAAAATPSIPIPPPVSPSDKWVILLGVYLIVMLILGVYFLSVMIRGEEPSKTIGEMRTACCGPKDEGCPPPTPTPTPNPSTTGTSNTPPVNTAAAVNSNQTATLANSNAANGNAAKPVTPVTNTNGNSANTKPASTPEIPEVQIPAYVCVAYFNRLPADGFLFLIVLFSGMVGSTVRGIYSFARHLGIKDFSFSWAWFYILLPFSGGPVSLFLYFVIRGGFYGSPVGKGLVLNLAAFVALGALSGLFSENAMEKLRQVAEVLLAKVPEKTSQPVPPSPPKKP